MSPRPCPPFVTAGDAVAQVLRKLTDRQALIERLEAAAEPGTSPSMRRKLLREAADFIRNSTEEAA